MAKEERKAESKVPAANREQKRRNAAHEQNSAMQAAIAADVENASSSMQRIRVPATKEELQQRQESGLLRKEVLDAFMDATFKTAEKFGISPQDVPHPKNMNADMLAAFNESIREELYFSFDALTGAFGSAAAALFEEDAPDGRFLKTMTLLHTSEVTPEKLTLTAFFALHQEIKPNSKTILTDLQKLEIRALHKDLIAFLTGKSIQLDALTKDGQSKLLQDFVKSTKTVTIKPQVLDHLILLLDPVSNRVFPNKDPAALKTVDYTATKGKKRIPVKIPIKITTPEGKALTPYHDRVHKACITLIASGQMVTTYSQIYAQMGNKGRPSSDDIKKIADAIDLMSRSPLQADVSAEKGVFPNYFSEKSKLRYKSMLLPVKTFEGIVNNNLLTSSIVKFLDTPPLLEIAQGKGQLTNVPLAMLQTMPQRQTDRNLQIQDSLLKRISHMRNAQERNKRGRGRYQTIKFDDAFFAEFDAYTLQDKRRVESAVIKVLDHFVETGFIEDYAFTEGRSGVRIVLPPPPQPNQLPSPAANDADKGKNQG
jgi:hypothetical protein